ncbi:MAG TPA: ABC transporter permease subunit [Thermoanaerobaculia bacterium]|nr:ABC transporter permease subunit [Thermoanaerobaculia bacterium]
MKAVWATYTRELRAYFFSPLAYIVMFFFLIVTGFIFINLVGNLVDPRVTAPDPALSYFFRSSWLMLILLAPVLTMRLISEELRSGSIEILMTAPITESQVVTGKYLAALTFYASLWLPTLVYAILIARQSEVDWGPVAAGYLGILSIGALLLAVGTFASATTRSQLVAAMVSVALVFLLFLLGMFEGLLTSEGLKQALSYVNLFDHIDELSRGIVDTRRLAYYGTGVLFFLFLATRALEDKKWR